MLPSTPRPRSIYIPDILASWPWPRSISPYYDICKAESSEWCESFGAFDKSAQEAFNKCDFNLIASLAYQSLDKDGCRIGCDLMNLFFVIDEHTDRGVVDVVRAQADIVMDAIYYPHIPRPKDEWIGGEVARQFWENAIRRMTPVAQHRFISTFQTYLDAVVEQAKDRAAHRIRTIETYFQVRRDTIGAKPSFTVNEMYMNIPNHIMRHPVIENLRQLTVDLIIVGNDLCSYNREQAQGDDNHNLVTIVMHEHSTDIQSSINWIGDHHERLVNQFLKEWHNIPSVTVGLPERSRRDVQDYCQSLANWVRANDSWNFESERYFGKVGRQVQNTRQVQLLPRLHTIPTAGNARA